MNFVVCNRQIGIVRMICIAALYVWCCSVFRASGLHAPRCLKKVFLLRSADFGLIY